MVAYVYFSEEIVAPVTEPWSVSITAAGRPCSPLRFTAPDTFGFVCQGTSPSEQFEISAAEGLSSAAGTEVAPFQLAVTAKSLPIGSSGCPFYRAGS